MSRRTTCVWVEQEDGDAWGCDRCGVLWVFHAYSPQEDKNMRFCPRCGRRIIKWIPLSWGSEKMEETDLPDCDIAKYAESCDTCGFCNGETKGE